MATTFSPESFFPMAQGPDTVDIAVLIALRDALDGRALTKCTSTTRPAAATQGHIIWETDTKAWGVFDGTVWRMYDTVWQAVSDGTRFTHSSAGGMTGNTCTVRYLRQGRSALVRWRGDTTAGTNYGLHGAVLLAFPAGLSSALVSEQIPVGTFLSTIGNAWHQGVLAAPPGDGSSLLAYWANNAGGPLTALSTVGSVTGNFIAAQATIDLA